MQKILTEDLHSYAYKMQLPHTLKQADRGKRRWQFVQRVLKREQEFQKTCYFQVPSSFSFEWICEQAKTPNMSLKTQE